ncbi:phage major capsid protein [Candidatus Pacearchaeota archaeon]|jgi:HK97 family phage major capsid protein|nr:phage major capsid protein [Candidatus Pacearchaeota archaeon]
MKTTLNLKQLQEAIQEKSKVIGTIFEEAGPDLDFSKVKCIDGDTNAKVEKIHALEAEMTDLHNDLKEMESLASTRKQASEAANFKGEVPRAAPGEAEQKSIGKLFVESQAFKSKGAISQLNIDLKTLVRTAAGWAPESIRLPRVELYPLRTLRVADVFPTYATGQSAIKYMEETTHTNNAAEIAEETDAASPTAYGEAAIVMTERSVTVEKIAVWIPVTDEQLSDVDGIEDFINSRLTYMIRNRLDGQLVAGDGSTPNLKGVLNASNIQSQALGSDAKPDAIFKAMTKIRGTTAGTGFAEPSAVLYHPNDWQDIRLLRTADGIYIFGNPSDPGRDVIWGVPVVVTSAETENTACVGDFANYAALYVRQGVEVQITNAHASLFTSGVQAIRATMRCAAVYFRGTAFCKVTGL